VYYHLTFTAQVFATQHCFLQMTSRIFVGRSTKISIQLDKYSNFSFDWSPGIQRSEYFWAVNFFETCSRYKILNNGLPSCWKRKPRHYEQTSSCVYVAI